MDELSGGQIVAEPQPPARSGMALAAFIIGIVGAFGWFIVLAVAVYANAVAKNTQERDVLNGIVGLSAILGLGVNFVGMCLGFASVLKPYANRWMGAVGLILNFLEIAFMVGIIILGITQGGTS